MHINVEDAKRVLREFGAADNTVKNMDRKRLGGKMRRARNVFEKSGMTRGDLSKLAQAVVDAEPGTVELTDGKTHYGEAAAVLQSAKKNKPIKKKTRFDSVVDVLQKHKSLPKKDLIKIANQDYVANGGKDNPKGFRWAVGIVVSVLSSVDKVTEENGIVKLL